MSDTVSIGKFTTYLGHLAKSKGTPLNGLPLKKKTLRVSPLLDKNLMGQYEAALTYCCYHSRLSYEFNQSKLLEMFKHLNYTPLVFNKLLSVITKKSIPSGISSVEQPNQVGYFLFNKEHDLPGYISVFDYTTPGSSLIFPGEKIMVVSFRGTLSLTTLLKDLKMVPRALQDVFGDTLFSELAPEIEKRKQDRTLPTGVNPFGAHRGFVNGMKAVYATYMEKIKELLALHPDVKRIFITGHSLGGAYTHIMSMGMAQEKKKNGLFQNQSLHAVSFGAPFTFLKMARDVYNGLLADGHLTLDRVITSARFKDPTFSTTDVIPNLPPNFYHPGFTIDWKEIKTQSRTGRTKHSRELREQFFNITRTKSSFIFGKPKSMNYNSLPTYEEFLSKFLDTAVSSKEYKSLLNSTYAGTIRSESDPLANKIRSTVMKLLGMNSEELKQNEQQIALDQSATEKQAKEQLATESLPENVKSNVQGIQGKASEEQKAIENAYKEEGNPMPPEEQEGGAFVFPTNQETKQYQPNTVVYSCYQNIGMLLPIPIFHLFTCHLNYMGVSWLGCVKQILVELSAQSKTIKVPFRASPDSARQFREVAKLYKNPNSGIYTMVPDGAPLVSNTSMPKAINMPKGGGKTRRIRRSRSTLI